MPADPFLAFYSGLNTFVTYLSYGAPFVLFFILIFVVPGTWLAYIQARYLKNTKFVLLELRPPREVRKTPRAMEQVFTALHSLGSGPELVLFWAKMNEKWWNGEVIFPYSLEMASFSGEIHFYMWVPERHRNIIEAALYSHYPDMEVRDAENYMDRLPRTYKELNAAGYEIFGTEFLLAQKVAKRFDVYPIRTYFDFEAVAEEKELDPISGVMEVLAKIRPQDTMWIQIILQPLIGEDMKAFRKEGEDVLKEMKAKSRSVKNEQTGEVHMVMPSPGETETMRAIERKISKPPFNAVIRHVYIGPKEGFSSNYGQRGVVSAFNQYASETYNKFRNNGFVWTRANLWYPPHFFPKARLLGRKERIMKFYRNRKIYDDTFMARVLDYEIVNYGARVRMITLNAEELATLFHLPTVLVMTSPIMKSEEARRVGPPAGLPIYGEEDKGLPGI